MDYESVQEVLRSCQGVVILAFNIGNYTYRNGDSVGVITEYNHIEGTLAIAQSLPTLAISEEANSMRGILASAVNHNLVIPVTAASQWVLRTEFKSEIEAWGNEIKKRYHVFLGYSSGARLTAAAVKKSLQDPQVGARVLDWMTDFRSGGTILDEISQAGESLHGWDFLVHQG